MSKSSTHKTRERGSKSAESGRSKKPGKGSKSRKKARKPRADVHELVTDQIIECMEAGAGDWQMPWHSKGTGLNRPTNIDTKNPYRGINVLSLWVASMVSGFDEGVWGTYLQWQKRGCQVRRGEKSSLVVFYKELSQDDTEAEAPDGGESKVMRVARASYVFNAAQVDGYVAPAPPVQLDPVVRNQVADRFVANAGAEIRHGGARAFYRPSGDFIQLPAASRFLGTATSSATDAYYGTLLHELTHWTGAKSRCDRRFGKRFGDDAYAMEELVAELGAAFLCADLQIAAEPRADHAAYLAHWLKIMKADKKAIFTAAAQAAKATDFLQEPGAKEAAPASAPVSGAHAG